VTCVVGVVGAGGVLLAGDAQWSDDRTHRIGSEPKVFELFEVLAIAYCGSGRLGQILTYHLTDSLEEPSLVMDEHYWAVREFIPYLRTVTQDHGHLHIRGENQVEELGQSAFLLAVRNRLFSVEADFSVNEHALPYEALGSGTDHAIGVLHSELGDDKRPLVSLNDAESVAKKAIKAAAKFGNFVGGPISVVRTVTYTHAEKQLARQILKAA
jgi:20S proteasome alpha/beta subunit